MTNADNRPTEIDRLAALRATGLLEGEVNPAFAPICAEVRERFAVSTAFVTLVDRSRLVIAAPERGEVPREHGFVGSSRVDLQACKLEYSIVSPK